MELEVNGITADLGNATPAISRKTLDINNPTDRFIDITSSFNLPYTPTNNSIFNSPVKIGSTNNSFDVLYNVKIIDQFFVFNGYGILISAKERDGYRFQVVEKSREVFTALEADLESMNWDDYDVYLNTTSKNAIDIESNNHPLVWPDVCYHEKKISANIGLSYSRPCLYFNGVLNLKLTELGYTYTAGRKIACTLNHENFWFTSYQKTLSQTVTDGNDITGLNSGQFSTYITVNSGSVDVLDLKTKFRLRGDVEVSGGDAVITVTATDSVAATTETQTFTILEQDTEIDIITDEFESENSTLDWVFSISGADITFSNTLLYNLHSENDRTDLDTNPFDEFLIKVQDNLPQITFKDLYKTICLVSNSIHVIDSFAKTFTYKSFSGLQKLRALDWTDKFIQETDDISAEIDGLAKKNWLKYNNDLTVNRFLGSDYFTTNNESLPDESDYIVIPFGASQEVVIGAQAMVSMEIYSDTLRIIDQTINIRLLEVDSAASSFSGLDWQNIKSNYYDNYFNSLLRVRVVDAEMDLKKLDVLGWDLVSLVYIEYYSSYFILLEIDNFVSGLKTKVKLLQYG